MYTSILVLNAQTEISLDVESYSDAFLSSRSKRNGKILYYRTDVDASFARFDERADAGNYIVEIPSVLAGREFKTELDIDADRLYFAEVLISCNLKLSYVVIFVLYSAVIEMQVYIGHTYMQICVLVDSCVDRHEAVN